jgi:hypothetical protein
MDKHSSLFCLYVSDAEKSFTILTLNGKAMKLFVAKEDAK